MKERREGKAESWWQPGLVLFARTSGWIGAPIIVALFMGHWLDRKYNTAPWLFLITVGAAFLISSFGIMRESTRAIKELEKDDSKKDNKDKE